MRLAHRSLLTICLFFGLFACNTGPSESSGKAVAEAPAASATASSTPAPVKAATFGAPITNGDAVALTDIEKSPASFQGKTITTTGVVTAVCQERGCWMAIKDEGGSTATVRMHGHSFFVPRSAGGKHARVQGNVVMVKDGKECDDMTAQGAQLELDATGVELM